MKWQFVIVNHETRSVRVVTDSAEAYLAGRVRGNVVLALPAPSDYSEAKPAQEPPRPRPVVQLVHDFDDPKKP